MRRIQALGEPLTPSPRVREFLQTDFIGPQPARAQGAGEPLGERALAGPDQAPNDNQPRRGELPGVPCRELEMPAREPADPTALGGAGMLEPGQAPYFTAYQAAVTLVEWPDELEGWIVNLLSVPNHQRIGKIIPSAEFERAQVLEPATVE